MESPVTSSGRHRRANWSFLASRLRATPIGPPRLSPAWHCVTQVSTQPPGRPKGSAQKVGRFPPASRQRPRGGAGGGADGGVGGGLYPGGGGPKPGGGGWRGRTARTKPHATRANTTSRTSIIQRCPIAIMATLYAVNPAHRDPIVVWSHRTYTRWKRSQTTKVLPVAPSAAQYCRTAACQSVTEVKPSPSSTAN